MQSALADLYSPSCVPTLHVSLSVAISLSIAVTLSVLFHRYNGRASEKGVVKVTAQALFSIKCERKDVSRLSVVLASSR